MNTSHLSRPEYEPNSHWVSPTNFDQALQGSYAFPRPLIVFDDTLRKMVHTSGMRPSIDDVLRVAEALEEVGIRQTFMNALWWGGDSLDKRTREVCKAIMSRGFAFQMTVSCDALLPRPTPGEGGYQLPIAQVVDTLHGVGVRVVEPMIVDPGDPAGRARQLEHFEEVYSSVQSAGLTCAAAVLDAGRFDSEHLLRVLREVTRLGAPRVDFLDSAGSLSPEAARLFISRIKAELGDVPVTLHIHNDFGLGSAAAIAAASAGAHPDVSMNGISYRSGLASMEEVVVSLELLYGVPTGIRLDRLRWLSDLVAEHIRLPNHPLKAITGSQAFVRDLPSWAASLWSNGLDSFPPVAACLAPSLVGGQMEVVWSSHIVAPMVRDKLAQMGLTATASQVDSILQRIEAGVEAIERYPRWLTDSDVEEICKEVVGGDAPAGGEAHD